MQMYFNLPHTVKIAKSNNYLKNEYTQVALTSTPISMKYQILKITPFESRRNHGLQVRTDSGIPSNMDTVSRTSYRAAHRFHTRYCELPLPLAFKFERQTHSCSVQ